MAKCKVMKGERMKDDAREDAQPSSPEERTFEDDHELTFEHGFGANEALRKDNDKSLADIAGVSEEDVREDLLEERSDGEGDEDDD